ncbi:MAG: replication initiator protein A [Smithella sp.]|nr:replication initiator protein A [Smithella sp.]
MLKSHQFDYYYGKQAEQFTFYRIPKRLFTDSTFADLSSAAKVLYGLMLDRMSLSVSNEWKDDQDRVFIYFTLTEIQELMNCGHNKAVRLLAELDSIKGIGLIERVKQGMGRPNRIYVMNFLVSEEIKDFPKEEVMTSEKGKSRVPEKGSQDFPKKELINTDLNKTEVNETEKNESNRSIYPSKNSHAIEKENEMDRWMEYRDVFKKNIDYEIMMQRYPDSIPEILEILVETACSGSKYFRINSSQIPAERVRERLLSLNSMHVEYVLDAMRDNSSDVKNIRAFLLSALYNASKTINSYYQARVNHDLYGNPK